MRWSIATLGLLLVLAAVWPAPIAAHPLDLASLRVSPGVDGAVDVRFDLTLGAPGQPVDVVPTGPCSELRGTRETRGPVTRVRATWDCGPGGLEVAEGTLPGAEARSLETVLVLGAGETASTSVLEDGTEAWTTRHDPAVFRPYARRGAEHILAGLDHLLFVGLLVVLVGPRPRTLAATITAFTVGHSVTLGVAALGGPAPAVGPTEALIAASILITAAEVARPTRGPMSDSPALVAGAFGLLHGFGFAGALASTGLPRGAEFTALLGFNLGVEAGQLLFVAMALIVLRVSRRDPSRLLAYGAGTWAAFLLIQRMVALG